MALLVLSLAKSILVVKLLHHSEKEVKEMSVSACLLDKYGSSSQSFLESTFTSLKTLDDEDQSEGTLWIWGIDKQNLLRITTADVCVGIYLFIHEPQGVLPLLLSLSLLFSLSPSAFLSTFNCLY